MSDWQDDLRACEPPDEERAEHRSRRRDRARHRDRRGSQGPRGRSRRELTPEERAYRQARDAANRKLGVMTHSVAYAMTLGTILVTTRSIRVVLIVAMSWGIGLALHAFLAITVPQLRQRWVDEEVGRRLHKGRVSEQRREIEDRHLRSLEDLSASIAHEIRNPITAAKSLVAQMGEDPTSSENIDYAGVALGELDRVERSISHLLKYAREEELHFEWLDVPEIVEDALRTFRDRFDKLGVRVERDLDGAGALNGDAEKLRRVVINLVGNALDAMEEAGTEAPLLRVSAGENLAGTEVWLRVRDNGPGVDAATRERIFSPFYTTKSSGTGLGLALSKKVVDAHGGDIELVSEPGEGTEFAVVLPKQSAHGRGENDRRSDDDQRGERERRGAR